MTRAARTSRACGSAITFEELEDYLGQLANPREPQPLLGSLPGRGQRDAGFLDSNGRPGASAMAQYRRRRASDWRTWRTTVPQRLAGVLAAGLVAALVTAAVTGPGLARLTGPAAAMGLAWLLRFRPSADTLAWRHGAEGERRTARLLAPLERHGYQVFHDLAVPRSPANVDHVVVGPTGVYVIDSKRYRGRLRYFGGTCGTAAGLWTGRYRRWYGRPPRSPRPSGSGPTCTSTRYCASTSPAGRGDTSSWWMASRSLTPPPYVRPCRSPGRHCRPSRSPWSPGRSGSASNPQPDLADVSPASALTACDRRPRGPIRSSCGYTAADQPAHVSWYGKPEM
jgi:hypothetical protein